MLAQPQGIKLLVLKAATDPATTQGTMKLNIICEKSNKIMTMREHQTQTRNPKSEPPSALTPTFEDKLFPFTS